MLLNVRFGLNKYEYVYNVYTRVTELFGNSLELTIVDMSQLLCMMFLHYDIIQQVKVIQIMTVKTFFADIYNETVQITLQMG